MSLEYFTIKPTAAGWALNPFFVFSFFQEFLFFSCKSTLSDIEPKHLAFSLPFGNSISGLFFGVFLCW
jgi:hypothetical protein